jgi:plastocyanin
MIRVVSAAAASVVLSISGIFASPALAAGTAWDVQAGSVSFESPGVPIGVGNQFYPGRIAIHQGDSVKFTLFGPHTVTYNRPPGPVFALFAPSGGSTLTDPDKSLNSGFMFGPPATFTVAFASTLPAGLYKFICALHFGMTGLVDVLPTSAALPKSAAEYAAIAQAEITRDLAALARINAEAIQNSDVEDGSPTVLAGAGNSRGSNLRFYPASVTIHVGQSITFLKTTDPTEPHTVTFGPEPTNELEALMARGGSTYGGAPLEQVSSGFMSTRAGYRYYQLAGTPLPVALTKYRLTFTNAGTFKYLCALHDGAGMVGVVHVVP